jgi:hypothetical protein
MTKNKTAIKYHDDNAISFDNNYKLYSNFIDWNPPGIIETFQGKITTKGGPVYGKTEVCRS